MSNSVQLVLCFVTLLTLLLSHTSGAPAKRQSADVAEVEAAIQEARDLQQLLETNLNNFVHENEVSQATHGNGGSGQDVVLPEFPRVEVEINDCPNCVPGSFRWKK